MDEGWFKSDTPGARKVHFFAAGDVLSACHLIRRREGEWPTSDGWEERGGILMPPMGFLTAVVRAEDEPRCRLCRAALLPEEG